MKITEKMKLAAAEALASMVETPSPDRIIPDALDPRAASIVAAAVKNAA